MGCVESTSSDDSNRQIKNVQKTKNVQNLKPHKPEEWEINLVGDLLLSILSYNFVVPSTNWMVKKSDLRKEFIKFTTFELREQFKELNGTDNIGTILYRTGFLCHTPRGSPYYELKSKDYIQKVIKRNQQNVKINQNEDITQMERLNKVKQKVDNNSRRGKKPPVQRNVQRSKLDNCDAKSVNDNMQNTSAENNGRKDECNEPTTSKAAMKSNLQKNSEEDSATIYEKSNLAMIFDELPRVPNINLETKGNSEIAIAQVRLMQHKEQNQQQYSDEDLSIKFNTIEVLASSPKYSTSEQEASIKIQQQCEDEEYRTQLLREQEGIEYAKKLQQQKEELASIILQQQYKDEEYRKKLQQELENKEYAEKLQQQYDEEELKNQNAQQKQPIATEIPNAIPPSPAPQLPSPQPPPQQTDNEIFKNRMAQLKNNRVQYSNYMWKIRNEHDQEEYRYTKYKFNWTVPRNEEYEQYYNQLCIKLDKEERDYQEFMQNNQHEQEDLLVQYNKYECCIQ